MGAGTLAVLPVLCRHSPRWQRWRSVPFLYPFKLFTFGWAAFLIYPGGPPMGTHIPPRPATRLTPTQFAVWSAYVEVVQHLQQSYRALLPIPDQFPPNTRNEEQLPVFRLLQRTFQCFTDELNSFVQWAEEESLRSASFAAHLAQQRTLGLWPPPSLPP